MVLPIFLLTLSMLFAPIEAEMYIEPEAEPAEESSLSLVEGKEETKERRSEFDSSLSLKV